MYPLFATIDPTIVQQVDKMLSTQDLQQIQDIKPHLKFQPMQYPSQPGFAPNAPDPNLQIAQIPLDVHSTWLYDTVVKRVAEINTEYFGFDIVDCESMTWMQCDTQSQHVRYSPCYNSLTMGRSLRKLSFVVQLSAQDDYTGGDLLVHQTNVPLCLSRSQGSLTVFPSWCLTEMTQVTKGIKEIVIGHLRGPAFR